jgi:hypothetical protein
MSLTKKQHVSKSGKSVLIFRRQSIPGTASGSPRVQNEGKPLVSSGPAIPIDLVSNPPRVYGKL